MVWVSGTTSYGDFLRTVNSQLLQQGHPIATAIIHDQFRDRKLYLPGNSYRFERMRDEILANRGDHDDQLGVVTKVSGWDLEKALIGGFVPAGTPLKIPGRSNPEDPLASKAVTFVRFYPSGDNHDYSRSAYGTAYQLMNRGFQNIKRLNRDQRIHEDCIIVQDYSQFKNIFFISVDHLKYVHNLDHEKESLYHAKRNPYYTLQLDMDEIQRNARMRDALVGERMFFNGGDFGRAVDQGQWPDLPEHLLTNIQGMVNNPRPN